MNALLDDMPHVVVDIEPAHLTPGTALPNTLVPAGSPTPLPWRSHLAGTETGLPETTLPTLRFSFSDSRP
jgi:hypothetical protein